MENLTITNQNATVVWPGVIDIQGIDFSEALELGPHEADIIEERLNNYTMEITMRKLPQSVAKFLPDRERAYAALKKIVSKAGENIELVSPNISENGFTFLVHPNKNSSGQEQ